MKLLRTLLVLLLSLAPILFWLLVWRPAESRMAANRVRVTEAEGRIQELPRYTPLSAEEATFLEDPSASTTVKTRIIARNQQVVRVDRERRTPLPPEQTERARNHLDAIAGVGRPGDSARRSDPGGDGRFRTRRPDAGYPDAGQAN